MKKINIFQILLITLIFLTSFVSGIFFSDAVKDSFVKKYLLFENKEELPIKNNNVNIKKEEKSFFNFILGGEEKSNNLDKKEEKIKKHIKNNMLDFEDLDFSEYKKTYDIIKKNYYNIDKVDNEELVYGTIKGLVNSIGDKHSVFMTPKETKAFMEILGGEFQGIGAVVKKVELGVEIEQVLKGAPALKAGLKSGDIIIKADGVDLVGLSIAKAVEKIKGKAGTKVKLTIFRKGEKDLIIKDVVRAKVEIPSVESKILDGEIGYIAINTFGDKTSKDFTKHLDKLRNKNLKGLIIDLRDNGGGYLISAVDILSHFIEAGKNLVSIKYRDKSKEENYFSKSYIKKEKYKIVVLINENTASASEITSLGLREYNKAIIVGKKSYGKGSVQEQFTNFKDGATLKLTIANWFTPKGNNIDGKGIIPDIEVDFKKQDYDFEECKKVGKCSKNMNEKDFKFYDRQLEVAKVILKDFIKNGFIQNTIDNYNKKNKKNSK